MSIQEATSYRITELCRQKHLNGYVVCSRAGIPASTYCCIMSGISRNPGIVNINRIASGLGITIREFYNSDIFDHLEPDKNE